ncbi:MAG: cobalt-precorrin-6A reductase [Alphaproteobacteria bacterium]|nr:cobalt-precorrin-6A reductase [Alphaproteobacteria bacterium]
MHILILGGTTEARLLGERLASRDLQLTYSLAGRTRSPLPMPGPVRIGGFGGAEGLAEYLRDEHIDILVDATHPYAAAMSRNAAKAAAKTGTPFIALHRPPWMPVEGDRWTEVANAREAVRALGAAPRRVFLALGRQEIAPFGRAPQHHYLVRSVEPVDPPLTVPHATYIEARGPFLEADDRALLETHRIEVVVSKNSGGVAAYGKIAAARALGIEVILLRRPMLPDAPSVATIAEAVAFIDHALVSGIESARPA